MSFCCFLVAFHGPGQPRCERPARLPPWVHSMLKRVAGSNRRVLILHEHAGQAPSLCWGTGSGGAPHKAAHLCGGHAPLGQHAGGADVGQPLLCPWSWCAPPLVSCNPACALRAFSGLLLLDICLTSRIWEFGLSVAWSLAGGDRAHRHRRGKPQLHGHSPCQCRLFASALQTC